MSSRQGRAAVHALTLFDVVIHSDDESYGLGGQGTSGLEELAARHQCNNICKALGLPDAKEFCKDLTVKAGEWEALSVSVPNVDLDPRRSPSPVTSDNGCSALTSLKHYGESDSSDSEED
ncbi:atypical/Alpha protein kinase [Coprinopsis cinerea okayama7|uniref:Atypical/Alpha protein kinase n=1 Tax=Coprinopsis cinerea (strain Okayama-7 / 130 / ATCC MYA-4618 / FGSC 9003) TaxID=240176 RepID=A8NTK4_COPC7|nr:atypical/Alpha protein kinase [Coprinopsis cinerea okayama7\|eukprot:XP_001836252.1 atypical/Alpha protein kinase [Coprinopsis cinerea okayama7\